MKRTIFPVLLLVLCLTVSACGQTHTVPDTLTFEDPALDNAEIVEIRNLQTGRETQIIYPDQVREIVDFVRTLRGASPVRGGTPDTYSLTLLKGFDTLVQIGFGSDRTICVGTGEETLSYRLEGLTARDVGNFLSLYESTPETQPPEMCQEDAVLQGALVLAGGKVIGGGDVWQAFHTGVAAGEETSMLLALGERPGEMMPVKDFYRVDFDGEAFLVTDLWGTRSDRYTELICQEFEVEPPYNRGIAYVLTNDPDWQPSPDGSESGIQLVYSDMIFVPGQMDLPQVKAGRLEYKGRTYINARGAGLLRLQELFSQAEELSYEPKTHSIGLGLDLVFETVEGEEIRLELDPLEELCRRGNVYYSYDIPDVPNRIREIWDALNLSQWPDALYTDYPEIPRP